MYQTLADMEHNFGNVNLIISDQSLDYLQWKRSEVLKLDEMKIEEEIVFNPYTNKLLDLKRVNITML